VNLLLLDASEVASPGTPVRLTGRRAAHLIRVVRVTPGATLRAGIVDGPIATISVLDVEGGDDPAVLLDVGPLHTATAPLRPLPLDVILAVPRPKALSRALQTLSAMGVRHIDLVNAWRVDASYFSSPRLAAAALDEDLRLGLEQAASTYLPTVAIHRLLVPFLDEVLRPRLAAGPAPLPLLAHPRRAAPIERALPPGDRRPVCLAIGPEGGWIERELDSFVGLGFQAIQLGPAILRTETAITAALAQIELLRRLPAAPSEALSDAARLQSPA
jgi:16S rRNA (uracil1498-N3)-methyltransferase